MNLKRFLIVFVLSFFSISLMNSLIIVKDTDEVDAQYILDTYGKGTKITAEEMIKSEFNEFQRFAKEDVVSNTNLSDEEKKTMMAKLKGMEFKYQKLVFFKIITDEPVLPADLKLDVKLLNAKEESLSVFDNFQSLRMTSTSNIFGIVVQKHYYANYWIIEADKQLVKKNYNADELPIKLIVTFPNGQKRTYNIKI